MPIPKPKKSESKDDYVSRCIAFLVGEGKDQEQASAIAYQQWEDRHKKKVAKTQYEFVKSIPMDMSFSEIRDKIGSSANKSFSGSYVNEIYLDGTCIIERYEEEGGPPGGYKYFRYDYTFNAEDEVVLTNPVEVVKDWEEVSKWSDDPRKVKKKSSKVNKSDKAIFMKDEEHRLVYGIALEPEVYDAQEHIISEEEIMKAAHDFMMGYRDQLTTTGEMHKKEAPGVKIVESYLSPVDFELNGQEVKKGSWVVVSKIKDDKLWKKVKDGEYKGYSIGGKGKVTPVKEDE